MPALQRIFNGVFAGQEYDLTTPPQNIWLEDLARERGALFNEALSGFLDEGKEPTDRFETFAEAIGPPPPPYHAVHHRAMVGAFGSLFNFGVDPTNLPFLRTEPTELLERTLGYPIDRYASASEKYPRQVGFARDVRDRLREAGVDARDMIDVSSLIISGLQYVDFWACDPRTLLHEARHSGAKKRRQPAYLSICAIYRDEAPYLAEWIEFHRLVGVERFFLYDHMSQDHHLEVLAPYLNRWNRDLPWQDPVPRSLRVSGCLT